ncbi:MAG: hypothetical protein ABI834_07585, partial [Ginsengibacter sp.]
MRQIFTLCFFIFFSFYVFAQHKYPDHFTGKIPNHSTIKKIVPKKKSADSGINKTNSYSAISNPAKTDKSLNDFAKGEKTINFNGQWKGGFNESSYGFSGMMGNDIDYVLELQTTGSSVSGFSYTYFNEGRKRYYTICKLTGTLNSSTREIVVTETERIKYNTPPDFQNCFQTHKLHYEPDSANVETLRGTWIPAPNQSGNCGYGTTLLSRRIINRTPLEKPAEKIIAKTNPQKNGVATKPYIAPKINNKSIAAKPRSVIKPSVVKKDEKIKDIPYGTSDIKKITEPIILPPAKFEPRRKDILKTIHITQPSFRIDFYDNGEIDGDSITVIYNSKIILSHKMLSAKAITLTLSLDENITQNIITMYADNLGTIPPNTALMIVTDGDKRYEVRITSDTEKSG